MRARMKKTSRSKSARFPVLSPARLSPAQRRLARSLLAGPRGEGKADREAVQRLLRRGPFNAWMRSPELGEHLQNAGVYVRFKTSLPKRLNELAILITARHWTSQFEWYAHRLLALKVGLRAAIIDQLALGRRPRGMKKDETVVYEFCTQLHRTKTVTDSAYRRAAALLGEQGVMDLIGASGYYTLVSMTLNVARVPVPAGEKVPLRSLRR
jgi:4-carboxymuconolactone decarboxylase